MRTWREVRNFAWHQSLHTTIFRWHGCNRNEIS